MKPCLTGPSVTYATVLVLTVLLLLSSASSFAAAAESADLSKAEIARMGRAATALVEVGKQTYGSAFCVHPSGLFVTNSHVIRDRPSELKLVVNSGLPNEKALDAKVVRYGKDLDLALLRAAGAKEHPAISLGSPEGLYELLDVVSFGYPFGPALATGRGQYPAVSITMGSVSSLRRKDGELFRIQLQAAVNPGASGGPLLDLKGKVVGMIVGRVEGSFGAGIDMAVPVNHLQRFLARPDIEFEPPAECDVNEPVDFLARTVSVMPSTTPLRLELVLSSAGGPTRRSAMQSAGDAYRAKATSSAKERPSPTAATT